LIGFDWAEFNRGGTTKRRGNAHSRVTEVPPQMLYAGFRRYDAAGETRNPNPETRRKAEIRNWNSVEDYD